MPVSPTYPGVYVQEISSGVRTVAGVPTSVAAFVGRAKRGKVNDPVTCFNFGEFTRRFGGLWIDGPLSYAVDDFFANGGGQCVVVRVFEEDGDDGVATANFLPAVELDAASPGEWGNQLTATVTYPNPAEPATVEAASKYGLAPNELFDLVIADAATGTVETFRNLTAVTGSARRADRVLADQSSLARCVAAPTDRPGEGTQAFAGGNDGAALTDGTFEGDSDQKTGLYALKKTDIFNLLCVPPDVRGGDLPQPVREAALGLCKAERALFIVDPPVLWDANPDTAAATAQSEQTASPILPLADADHAALFFPQLRKRDPLRGGQVDTFPPCGAVAGVMARTDTNRGVWKAPAGIAATIANTDGLTVKLTDEENGLLNPIAINCLRTFPNVGRVVWGSRTLKGSDQLSDDYKYIPVRRLALFIEESLYRGTQWVVFEGNDEPLWAQIRLTVGAFMQRLFRQGAFQGTSPRDAYFVKCDSETTTQDDINRGIVNIVVGFAPLQPAEFVIISIQQIRNAA
jgi:Bacteriophage tail sheath protein